MTTTATRAHSPELEAARLWRRLPAARKRAEAARARADRNPTTENHAIAAELEAGHARMLAEYRAVKAGAL